MCIYLIARGVVSGDFHDFIGFNTFLLKMKLLKEQKSGFKNSRKNIFRLSLTQKP